MFRHASKLPSPIAFCALLLNAIVSLAECPLGDDRWITAIDNLSAHANWDEDDSESATWNPPQGYALAEHRVDVLSEHAGGRSVSILAGGSRFASSAHFDSARNYLLDIVGQYSDEKGKKEFEGKLNKEISNRREIARQFEASHETIHAEVTASGSGNPADQQSGWMTISVQARIYCVGEPNSRILADQIADKVGLTRPSSVGRIVVSNQCNNDIDIALSWKTLNGTWETDYWWEIGEKKTITPTRGKSPLLTNNSIFYFYAKSESGEIWDAKPGQEGSNENVDGKSLRFRKMKLTRDSDGDWSLNLSCN